MAITDLLYLDRARARRLLGDVDGAVLEQVVSSVATRRSGRLTGKVPGLFEAGGDVGGDSKVEETLTVDDAILSVLNETLDASELLVSPAALNDPSAWERGDVHAQLEPAQLVRVTCAAQLIDPEYFEGSVMRVVDALETIALFAAGQKALSMSANDRKRVVKHVAQELMGGMSPDVVRQIGKAIQQFFGQGLFIRQLPCGTDARAFALLGTLRTDVDALLDDRAGMFAKYGAAPSRWTVLSQIATVTEPPPDESEVAASGEGDEEVEADEVDKVDRTDFERLAGEMMVALESGGLSGGPVWPTITVSPIAVYRSAAGSEHE